MTAQTAGERQGAGAPATAPPAQGPPFGIGGPTTSTWREHVLTRVAEHRFLTLWLAGRIDSADKPALIAIEDHLKAAEDAAGGADAKPWTRLRAGVSGSAVERARSQLDAAESELLHLAPDSYLLGQLPSLVAHVRSHLDKDDPRRIGVEEIYKCLSEWMARRCLPRHDDQPREVLPYELDEIDRDAIVTAVRNASSEARREVARVRSFRNVLWVAAAVVVLVMVAVVALGASRPELIPLCFNPEGMVVCPTGDEPAPGASAEGPAGGGGASADARAEVDDLMRDTADGWDIALVAAIGVLGAALAATTALRRIKGTSTEYSLPLALAILKLPTGALTAVLGLLLMRGEFVPGLSALDSPAQILAWAAVFGYAQQLLTRFVDQRAQGVLADVGPGDPAPTRTTAAPALAA
jgi:hypothetical protein